MNYREQKISIGDEPRNERTYRMATCTCPDCGGRGGSYDDEGNWSKCNKCNGTGQVDC